MPAEPTYAVVWRDRSDRVCAGRAEIDADAVRLRGRRRDGAVAVDLRYPDLAAVRIGRSADERLDGLPTLVLELRDGGRVLVGGVTGAGTLAELADRLAPHAFAA
jgi:hypothetical protein